MAASVRQRSRLFPIRDAGIPQQVEKARWGQDLLLGTRSVAGNLISSVTHDRVLPVPHEHHHPPPLPPTKQRNQQHDWNILACHVFSWFLSLLLRVASFTSSYHDCKLRRTCHCPHCLLDETSTYSVPQLPHHMPVQAQQLRKLWLFGPAFQGVLEDLLWEPPTPSCCWRG